MRLRQIFEKKVSEVAIIFGRFNPPHKGHKAAWETADQKDVWYVGTNQSTVGPKDPLPYDVKVECMKVIWPEVAEHVVPETSWLTLASYVYKNHGNVKLVIVTDEAWVFLQCKNITERPDLTVNIIFLKLDYFTTA
jgi:ATP sulfurylase